MSERDRLVFDIESQKTFDEVGGIEHRDELGVSYLGVYSYNQNKLFGFFEQDMEVLEKIIIKEKPMLIGFNSIHFDVPVMQPYFKNFNLSELPHLDLLKEVEKVLGHRLKLDSIAQSTLYTKKSGMGLDAIRWYRSGELDKLARYCLDDVEITRDVYEYGLRHGVVYYMNGGQKTPVKATWAVGETIAEKIDRAHKEHRIVEIVYIDGDENEGNRQTVKYTINILEKDGDRIRAYIEEMDGPRELHIDRMFSVKETERQHAHQGALF